MKNFIKFLNFDISKLFVSHFPKNNLKELKIISKDINIEMTHLSKNVQTASFSEKKVLDYDQFVLDKIYGDKLNFEKLSSMSLKIEQLEKTNRDLHNDNRVLYSDNSGLQQHNKELLESYNNIVPKFNKVNTWNNELITENQKLKNDNDTIIRGFKMNEIITTNLWSDLSKEKAKNQELIKDNDAVTKVYSDFKQKVIVLEEKLKDEKMENETLKKENNDYKDKMYFLENDFKFEQIQNKKLKNDTSFLNSKAQAVENSLKNEIVRLKEIIAKAQIKICDYLSDIDYFDYISPYILNILNNEVYVNSIMFRFFLSIFTCTIQYNHLNFKKDQNKTNYENFVLFWKQYFKFFNFKFWLYLFASIILIIAIIWVCVALIIGCIFLFIK